jgi:hypothetical protein
MTEPPENSGRFSLQLVEGLIELLPESDLVEFLLLCLVESFADSVGLWMLRFGPRMIDVVESQVELVFVALHVSAVFSATIGEDPQQGQALALKEGQYPIIQ